MKNLFSADALKKVLTGFGFATLMLCVSSVNSMAQLDTVIVPYLSTGYKYQQVSSGAGTGFDDPGFNDTSWSTGQGGFGTIGGCPLNNSTDVNTAWSILTDMLVRKHFTLPVGAGIRVSVAIDNDVQVFINGHDISGGLVVHDGCAERGSFVFTAPSNFLNAGDNVIAVRGHDRGVDTYLDIQVAADLPQVYYVTDTFDGAAPHMAGTNSLRDAINEANTTLGVDTIKFNLPGSGVHTFYLNSALPDITDPVVIDGYTQPGASPNTLATGNDAVLQIEIQPGESPAQNAGPWNGLVIYGGNSTVRGLVLNSFFASGIALLSSSNLIEGNFIGTDPTGTFDEGCGVDGVFIGNETLPGDSNTIGGTTPAARNLISGNDRNGITFDQVVGTVVAGNYIGTNAAGTAALGNSEAGIGIYIGSNHTIGGTTSNSRNVVSGNGFSGIELNSASFVTIANNYIGTNAAGTAALGNGDYGVFSFNESDHITIGGPGTGNLISGNSYVGVWIRDGSNCTVSGNFIGVDAAGSSALANGNDGVLIGDYGALPAQGNSQGDRRRNRRVTLPRISTGTGLLAAQSGAASSTVVGGASVSERNVISGNQGAGVRIVNSTDCMVAGNYIGVNAAGTDVLENAGDGVGINFSSGNTVGPDNVISGNTGAGVGIFNSSNNVVRGNKIGTDATGTTDLGNQLDGVIVDITSKASASSNSIGGTTPGDGNVIAFNGENGVRIEDDIENSILGNSIFENGFLGIDLEGDGVTPNHTGAGNGANNLQNYPVVAFAAFDLQGIAGFLNSQPFIEYRVELFSNTTADPTGYGEGQTFLAAVAVTTDSTGLGTFYVDVPGQLTDGQFITATATDPDNNTSEFSAATIVSAKVKVYGDHFVVNTTISGIPLHWADGNATFKVSTNVPPQYRTPIIDGYGSWSDLPQVVYSYGGTTDTTTWGGDPDGVNNNVWVESGWDALTGADSNTIAVTRVRYNTLTGEITDADIAFDEEHFLWDETGTNPAAMDVQNTATHEIGHFSGLGDIYDPGNPGYVPAMGSGNQPVTMFGLIARGETSKRSLDVPDSAGIDYIYSHIPAERLDIILVFDGSSGFSTTLNGFGPSKNSSAELIQKLRIGDRVGAIKMPGTVVLPLTAIVDSASRAQATAAVSSLVSGGSSAIGSGLQAAQAQLDISPLPNQGKAMILFSAGEEDAAPGALSVLGPIIAAQTQVFTLGFQGNTGQALSNKIADSTGGLYYLAADSTISQIVNQIWNKLSGQQQTFYTVAPSDTFRNVPQPGLQWQGPVDKGTTSILPGIQWQGPRGATFADALVPPSSFVLSLLAPGGVILIDSAYVAAHPELGIQFFSGPTYQFFKINNPIPGLWTLNVFGRTVPDINEPVVLSITAFTDITMAVGTDKITYQPDQSIQMSVALSEGGQASPDPHVTGGGPITDAIVIAKVKPPDPDTVRTVALNHIGVGVYMGSFDSTHAPGTYGITFIATRDTIERTATEAVFVVPPFIPHKFIVINTNDAGAGSLRQAILDANATTNIDGSTPDTICFNIAGGGPHTIAPDSALETVSDPVIIDGYSQPGSSKNTLAVGDNAVLKIILSGASAPVPGTTVEAGKKTIDRKSPGMQGVLGGTDGLTITAGNTTVQGLVINGFSGDGIHIQTGGSNIISGNFIGTNATGTTGLGNSSRGIFIDSSPDNTVGGMTPGTRNIISANFAGGVRIFNTGATGNKVSANYIGTDANGTSGLGNLGDGGINISSGSNNTIGGTTAGERNIISGNPIGVFIAGTLGTGNIVAGNYIGTDANGAVDIGNITDGVVINSAPNNTVGGTTVGERNVISGNNRFGVAIVNCSGNKVTGNYIGTDATGTTGIGNSADGVAFTIFAFNNTVGGTGANSGNTIAFNGETGVRVFSGTRNSIDPNSIFGNVGIGIDLDPAGASANDAGDADTGPNNLQNFPEMTLAQRQGNGDLSMTYSVPSTTANSAYPLRIEFFKALDGEGKTFLGVQSYTAANAQAAVTQTFTPDVATSAGDTIVATATDSLGNTSEFSAIIVVTSPPPTNVVTNPGFESGTLPWVFFTNGTGNYVQSAPGAGGSGSAAKVTVTTTGNNVQFYQSGITLMPGVLYRLKFKAYSSNGRDLSAFVQRHDAPYTNYGVNNVVFQLTTTWQEFEHQFTTINFPPPTPSNARLRFRLNGFAVNGTMYYIDDVVLEQVVVGPPVATKINVETAPDGSGNVVPAQTITSGTAITVYAISRDAADNFLANVSATWTLQNIIPNVVAGDLVPNGDTKSAVFTGNLAGSANIKATLGALTAVQSGLITVIPPPPPATNLLTNGGFESGTSNWSFSTNGIGTFSTVSPGFVGTKAAQVAISIQGTVVQLYQSGISLTSGSNYRLSFKARSNTGHDVQVSIFKHGSPFTPYGLTNYFFNLTNAFASYSVDFTASGFAGTVSDARFRFWMGPYDALGDLYFFDDVKLELLPAPPDAENPNPESPLPAEFTLAQNFPNPFNPSTTIIYTLPVDARVTLDVYDVLGQRVAQLVDEMIPAGYHDAIWDASELSSGMYLYRLTAAGDEGVLFTRTGKMLLTK